MPLYEKRKAETCGGCVHFRRHYLRFGDSYVPLWMGHCVFPRLKDRADSQSCPHFTVAAPAESPDSPGGTSD